MVKSILKRRENDLGRAPIYVSCWFEDCGDGYYDDDMLAAAGGELEKIERQGKKRVTWFGGILFKPVLGVQNGLSRHWKDWFDRYGEWGDFGLSWGERRVTKESKRTSTKQSRATVAITTTIFGN